MTRTGFIGGSDLASVLSIDYGCARRLWYQKTNTPEDRPRLTTGIMETGTWLEAMVAERTADQTGWTVKRRKQITQGHEAGNIDRHIVAFDERGPGVLEIKIVGNQTFNKWRFEGIDLAYMLQLQWYFYLTGWTWGVIAAWNREHTGDSAVKLYTFKYDATLIEQVRLLVDQFWKMVEDGERPLVLEPRDHRCDGCAWLATCKSEEWAGVGGEERRDELVQIVDAYKDAQDIVKSAEMHLEECRDAIEASIGDAALVMSGPWKISWKVQESRRVSTDLLRQKHPLVYEECAVKSVSRPLRITRSEK